LSPTYLQVREQEGQEAAQRLFSSVMVCSAGLLIVFSILLGIASSYILPILGSGFSTEKLALTRTLFFIVLPTLPLSGLFVTWAAILNAGERFALAAIAPVLTPIVVILMVHGWGGRWGVYAFALAMVAGAVLEACWVMGALKRQGISPIPRWYGITPSLRDVAKQYIPMIAAALMMGSTGLVDQSMAAMLGPGSVSVLNYGNRISAVIVTIGATAVSTAVLPQFSRMVAAGLWDNVRSTIKTYARLIFFITIPLSLIMILISQALVTVLFQRGAFTPGDTLQVAAVQSLYILQLPFYVVGMLFVRLISAFKANHILMWGTAISFVLNISLDYLFMKRLGVPGIALSTSVVYLVSFCYLWRMSSSLLKQNGMNPVLF
jgi:putative peptidoglycan lipid II flippase